LNPERQIREAVTTILEAIGENPQRDGLRDTPARVAELYRERFSGLHQDPQDALASGFEEGHQEMVVLRDIPFYSMCEHHLLPFFGTAHIGYIPRGRIVGLSNVAQALDILARRPQLQERLTTQMADALMNALKPEGVAVVLDAEHLCMLMRGAKRPGSNIVTSAVRGAFRSRPSTRAEFLSLIHGR